MVRGQMSWRGSDLGGYGTTSADGIGQLSTTLQWWSMTDMKITHVPGEKTTLPLPQILLYEASSVQQYQSLPTRP